MATVYIPLLPLHRCCWFDAYDGALKKRNLLKGMEMPRIRTDNGPQFVANIFEEKCEELGITHERIPNKTPNLVAHIEAFHFILEDECYSWHEFDSFLEVYREVTRFMQFYNLRRKHGSLKNLSPVQFYKANQQKTLSIKSFSA